MKHVESILQREMTRKEFLVTLGVGLVSVMGMGALMRLLFGKSSVPQRPKTASTYGGSTYGGSSDPARVSLSR